MLGCLLPAIVNTIAMIIGKRFISIKRIEAPKLSPWGNSRSMIWPTKNVKAIVQAEYSSAVLFARMRIVQPFISLVRKEASFVYQTKEASFVARREGFEPPTYWSVARERMFVR